MIAAKDGDTILKADFETDEECHGFHAVVAAINIVPHEQVVGVRTATSNLEKLHEIMELAMNITTDGYWALYRLHIDLT